MIDVQKYKDYIAIFSKDSNKLCGLLKEYGNDKIYFSLCNDYFLIYVNSLTEEDFKGYAWARDIAKFVEEID